MGVRSITFDASSAFLWTSGSMSGNFGIWITSCRIVSINDTKKISNIIWLYPKILSEFWKECSNLQHTPEPIDRSSAVEVARSLLHPSHSPSLSPSKSNQRPKPQPFQRIGYLIHRISLKVKSETLLLTTLTAKLKANRKDRNYLLTFTPYFSWICIREFLCSSKWFTTSITTGDGSYI